MKIKHLILAMFLSTSAQANSNDYIFDFGIEKASAKGGFDSDALGLRASYKFADDWKAELGYRNHSGVQSESASELGLRVKYYPFEGGFKQSYFSLGGSALSGDNEGYNFTSELGQHFYVSDRVSITPFAGFNAGEQSQLVAGVNVAFSFGVAKPKYPTPVRILTVSAPLIVDKEIIDGDDDMDDVLNSIDQCPDTNKNLLVDDTGCPIIESYEDAYRLDINFNHNSSVIDDNSKKEIEKFYNILTKHENVNVTIHGHTSLSGSEKYNKILSEKRAKSVVSALIEKGIDKRRLEYVGWGEEKPLIIETTKETEYENRRVEAQFSIKQLKYIEKIDQN